MLSYDSKNLYVLDLKSKSLLSHLPIEPSVWVIAGLNATLKKKKSLQNQKLFLLKHENGELKLEYGKNISIIGLFEMAIIKKNLPEIFKLLMENVALQTMEILRKLEDFPDFFEILQTNEKLKKTVRRIEEDWIERSKPNKIDFLTNIVRKEEPHILKERTKMIENRLFKSFDEKYIRKIDVSLIKTQNKEHLRKMI